MDDAIKKWLLETLGQSKDFILDQAPDVVHQYLQANLISSLAEGIFIVMLQLVGLLMIWNRWRNKDEMLIFYVGIIGTLEIVLTILSLCMFENVFFIYFYPKAYLLKHLLHQI